jgi:hypothetical protein
LPTALYWHVGPPSRAWRWLLVGCLALLFFRHPRGLLGDASAKVSLALRHGALLGFFALAAWRVLRAPGGQEQSEQERASAHRAAAMLCSPANG